MKLSNRTSFLLAIALGSFALIGGTGLTVSSAWLVTMASQHPPILILGVSIVMVRFFGIFRSVARYGERVISHEAIFRKLTGIRVLLFSAFASRLGKNSDISIARQSKAVIDDVERAQEFHLRITLPGISAGIAGTVTILLALWIEPFLIPYVLLVSALFAILIPWGVRRLLDPLAIEIEEGENNFATAIASSSHAMIEADIFGYGDFYRNSLTTAAKGLRELERRYFAITSLFALLVVATIGGALMMSLFLKAHRAVYYDRLTAIRTHGHWEQWLMFFLRGVSATALAATQTAKDIVALRDAHRNEVAKNAKALTLLDHLFRYPTVSVNSVRKLMGCTFPTASKLIADFETRGWVQEVTGHERNRLWRYRPYLELFHRDQHAMQVRDFL